MVFCFKLLALVSQVKPSGIIMILCCYSARIHDSGAGIIDSGAGIIDGSKIDLRWVQQDCHNNKTALDGSKRLPNSSLGK